MSTTRIRFNAQLCMCVNSVYVRVCIHIVCIFVTILGKTEKKTTTLTSEEKRELRNRVVQFRSGNKKRIVLMKFCFAIHKQCIIFLLYDFDLNSQFWFRMGGQWKSYLYNKLKKKQIQDYKQNIVNFFVEKTLNCME